ncbi:hypothetical protein HYU18_04205 [Candidatus Woesearchaeota archaeon]|nr:hypothetical protein [Candidatus Woesearchaeota archaeon]
MAAIALLALLSATAASAYTDCTPACPSGYSQKGSIDCSEQKTCKVSCYRPPSCGDYIDEVEEKSEDTENSDYVELSYEIDFGVFEDRGKCSGNSCLTNYCYKFLIDTEATATYNEDPKELDDMETYCEAEEDLIEWYDSTLIDEEKEIRLDGKQKAIHSTLATIYPKDKKPSLNAGEARIVGTSIGWDEDIYCEFESDEDVDKIWAKARWNLEMYQFLPEDTKQGTCAKSPEAPKLSGIPDKSTPEDTALPANFIDLHNHYSDGDGASDPPTFAIQSQSNPGLIYCLISSNRYVNCNPPTTDASGFTDITIKVTDTYSNSASDTFRITVTQVKDFPQFSVDATDDSEKGVPTPVGELVTFTAAIQDSDNDNVKLLICDKAGIKDGECLGAKYCSDPISGTETAGDKLCTLDTTTLDKPSYAWTSFACDSTGACTAGESDSFFLDIKAIQNLKFLVGEQEAASVEDVFTGQKEVNIADYLNDELESCIPDEEGYCTIPLTIEAEGEGTVALKDLGVSYDVPNEPPALEAAELTVKEGDLAKLTPKASDPDDFALTYSYPEPFDAEGKWQTTFEDAGEYAPEVTVSDGELTDKKQFRIIVANVNRQPTIESSIKDELEIKEGDSLKLDAAATDPDSDELSFAWHLDGEEVSSESAYTYTPGFADSGIHSITFTATDGELSASLEYSISVANTNRQPIMLSAKPESRTATVRVGKQQLFEVTAEDPDGEEVTYKWLLDGKELPAAEEPNSYLLTPLEADIGSHVLTAEASDGSLAATETFTITVQAAPECNPGETKSCPLQLGVCKGSQTSCPDEKWQPCDYPVHSGGKYQATETACDGFDNDCDGQTDEDVKNACGGCGPVPAEACGDKADNDCDGMTDEGCPSCSDGIQNQGETGIDCGGPCTACYVPPPPPPPVAPPSQQCSDGTPYNACSTTKPYYCNGAGSLVQLCGSCGCPASQNCQSDGSCKAPSCIDGIKNQDEQGVDCGGACTKPGTETCNGKDDNNNCQADENLNCECLDGQKQPCGTGACSGGEKQCSAGKWGTCSTDNKKSAEVCDNTDNNCNGQTDELLTKQCGVSAIGACKHGQSACSSGIWQPCVGNIDPVKESCGNGIDDNCNGETDDYETCKCECDLDSIPWTISGGCGQNGCGNLEVPAQKTCAAGCQIASTCLQSDDCGEGNQTPIFDENPPDCCGDPSDPCGWHGDGICDSGCAWGHDPDCN